MHWSVFRETLRREIRGTLFWSLGLAFYGLVVTMVLPDQAGMQQMVESMDALPPFIFRILGVEDIGVLVTPAGFLAMRYFLIAGIMLAVWAVLSGLNVVTNDETSGITNMVVSLPVSRQRLLIERVLAHIVPALIIPMAGVGGLALGMVINPNARADLTPIILSSLMMTMVALPVFTLTVLLGAVIPRRGLVLGMAGGFVAASFVLKSVANFARSEFGNTMAELSVFHHSDAMLILRNGFPVVTAFIMLVLTVLMAFAAARFFQRRDLAT